MAAITLALPTVTLRTGFAYLRLRKQAHRMSRIIERDLVTNGLPQDTARKLAENFESGLSVRGFVKRLGGPFLKT